MAYTFSPLTNERSVRMLILAPGSNDDVLRGHLEVVAIDILGSYEAISYVWGGSNERRTFVCEGLPLSLTTSLYLALTRLRLKDRTRRLWADQICIDQENLEERGQQVQFMNRIYRSASHVLVWLGQDHNRAAATSFKLFRDLSEIHHNKETQEKTDLEYLEHHEYQSEAVWAPLKVFTNLAWFTRAWIVQEIGTQAPATLFWGTEEIDWELVFGVCEALASYHGLRKRFDIQTSKVRYVFQRFVEPEWTSRHANRFCFIYELHRARHLQVSDPRDRVFALLGHYSIRQRSGEGLRSLKADYTRSVDDVYIDLAARALYEDAKSLITLAAVQYSTLELAGESALPSWVPDWRQYSSHILSEPTCSHRAHGGTIPRLTIDLASRSLVIHGIIIDSIAKHSAGIRPKSFYADGNVESTTVETLWRDVCGKNKFGFTDMYVNGETALFAFLQTLSNGCATLKWNLNSDHHAAPAETWLAYGAAYLSRLFAGTEKITDEIQDRGSSGDASQWIRAANSASTNRSLAVTDKGYYVLGPKVLRDGDMICVLFGGKMPFCLRPREDGTYYLVGECYVHGFMEGQAIDDLQQGRRDEAKFTIV
ncbi:hypothetical protein PFICI_00202 [Pestalotiopsis fici W106-1]|uniref:Heterokaryon incompatibility domain-containing protein n=1 Tax=Pestalotiopsis fici (strain W106-1 / CGMCC3.15140) TaxID=1229662 RepID=W3XK27_PESFW|nr:uncharacterized protein PFICI_00202 [Pestalotiopsis fici W106-1]ETS86374.1 hypothetical protein PFICI_00202 [Pestalotiopsis fici W106-1]